MNTITRRDALRGATAAAVVTGAATVPLAVKAAGAKAALAGASDARIFALIEEYDRTFAETNKASWRTHEAMLERMPPHLRDVSPFDRTSCTPHREFWDAVKVALDYPEVEALKVTDKRLEKRCREIAAQISQTEATTLEGVHAKMRFAMQSDCFENDIVHSATADLERLAGEVAP